MDSPIIITGMHRSGTTLLAQQLQEQGVFMGSHLDPNLEDYFFLKRNEWLMRRAGGSWHAPSNTPAWLAKSGQLESISRRFARDVRSFRFARFMGIGTFLKSRARIGKHGPWGWKDPRMVFTMPAWRSAFPAARLLYVRRNGVDVAASLRARDRQRMASPAGPGSRPQGPSLVQRLSHACQGFEFHAHYLFSDRETTLQSGFELWEQYVAQGERLFAEYSGPKLALRFEDLAAHSETALQSLASFAGLSKPDAFIASWKATVRTNRAHAFLADSELRDFYAKVRHSTWMRKLDYSDLV